MSRDIYAYGIVKNPVHSDVCMQWNCVPCLHYDDPLGKCLEAIRQHEPSNEQLKKSLKQSLNDYDNSKNRCIKEDLLINSIFSYLFKNRLVCPVCSWYSKFVPDHSLISSLYNNNVKDNERSIVKHSYNISHSDSNPIWYSDWCISRFLFYFERHRSYPRDNNCIVYDITPNKLNFINEELQILPKPVRTPDKEALNETIAFINWAYMVCEKGYECIVYCEF